MQMLKLYSYDEIGSAKELTSPIDDTMDFLSLYCPNIEKQAYATLLAYCSSGNTQTLFNAVLIGRHGVGKNRVTTELLIDLLQLPHAVSFTYLTTASLRDIISVKFNKGCTLIFSELNSIFKSEHSLAMEELFKQMSENQSIRVQLKTEQEIYVPAFKSNFIGNINKMRDKSPDYIAAMDRCLFLDFPFNTKYIKSIAERRVKQDDLYEDTMISSFRSHINIVAEGIRNHHYRFTPSAEGQDFLLEKFNKEVDMGYYISIRDMLIANKVAATDAAYNDPFSAHIEIPFDSYLRAADFMIDSIDIKAMELGGSELPYMATPKDVRDDEGMRGFNVNRQPFECESCGYEWFPKLAGSPKKCAKCRSIRIKRKG